MNVRKVTTPKLPKDKKKKKSLRQKVQKKEKKSIKGEKVKLKRGNKMRQYNTRHNLRCADL
jgi:hypothetical protein